MSYDFSFRASVKPCVLSVALITVLPGCASLSPSANDGSDFRKALYASAGVGASRLTPSVENFPNLDVNDRVEPAGQVTVGADLSPTFSVEFQSADLGSAGFSPAGAADGSSSAGRLNYHLNGISALAYIGGNKDNYRRKGFTGFGRLGLASIDNSIVGSSLVFEREDSSPVIVGAGLEYATSKGLGLRAEALTNGDDTSYGQVGVLYRLGLGSKRRPKLAAAKPAITPEPVKPAKIPKPVVAAAKKPIDSDRDGVADDFDSCLSTPFGIAVNSNGCEAAASFIDMVLFDVDSAELTSSARSILSNVASQMNAISDASLNLEGHADSTGDADYNMALSERRARNVARYLVGQGVKQSQLSEVNSFGEDSPAEGNDSVDGRSANRRVELHGKGFVR